jgi:hypothetical protein
LDQPFWTSLFVLVLLVLFFFIFILPIVLWVRVRRVRRDSAKITDIQQLIARVYALEQAVKDLRSRVVARPATGVEARAEHDAEEPVRVPAVPSALVAQQPGAAIPSAPVVHAPSEPAAPSGAPPSTTVPPFSLPSSAAPPLTPASPAASSSVSPVRAPVFGSVRGGRTAAEGERLASLEEKLGANWLNKIGTAAFVIGVALLINYSLHYFGPAGKISLGYGIAGVFIALGVFGERSERYRIGARAVLGGGWALAYFTTYALHNIASVRLIADPVTGFVLLFFVAMAMVVHSLRYHSEVTTGFAFLLGYLSVAVGVIPFGALIASAVLGAALIFILRQRRWYAIEPFAIVATYVVHWTWLTQVYERIGGHKLFPEFEASGSLLTLYWLIFIVSYFLRPDGDAAQKRWLTASFLLNALGYLVVLHQQSFHPDWRFRFLVFAGAVYLLVAFLARRAQRQLGYLLATTLGAGMLVTAIPYKYSGARLEILWLVEIEALFAVGWQLADRHLRRLGWAASIVLCGWVLFVDVEPRFERWHPPNHELGWMLLVIAVAFYLNAEWRRLIRDEIGEFESAALQISPIAATIFLMAAAWVGLHWMLAGFVWTVSAGVLLDVAHLRRDAILRYCAYGAAAAAVVRLTFVNIPGTTTYYGYSVRLMTVAASAAILYLLAPRAASRPAPAVASQQEKLRELRHSDAWQWFLRLGGFPMLFAGAATLLLSLLLWEEVANAGVALAWGILAGVLIETGEGFQGLGLIGQGRLLLVAAFARVFFADLNATTRIGPVTARTLTVSVLAAIFYWAATKSAGTRWRPALLWFGSVSIAALARFELPLSWVAVAWAILAAALFALSWPWSLRTLRLQCYVFTVLAAIRCAFDNFYQVVPWYFTNVRVATVSVVSIIFLLLAMASRQIKNATPAGLASLSNAKARFPRIRRWIALLDRHPYHLFFFTAAILITRLLSLEIHHGYLTAAWGAEALVVFVIALNVKERSYRWCALLLLLLCVGRIVLIDVWTLDQLGRIVSFMGLGAALLIVSFLYARHRELLRKVL